MISHTSPWSIILIKVRKFSTFPLGTSTISRFLVSTTSLSAVPENSGTTRTAPSSRHLAALFWSRSSCAKHTAIWIPSCTEPLSLSTNESSCKFSSRRTTCSAPSFVAVFKPFQSSDATIMWILSCTRVLEYRRRRINQWVSEPLPKITMLQCATEMKALYKQL